MDDDTQDTQAADPGGAFAHSLLPYAAWIEEAYRVANRQIMLAALDHAAASGLPGGHHFYLTFRTDHPGVAMPQRLRAQYPQEMTIVLQHQFWDLTVDRDAKLVSVGLSFGGVPSTLVIPFDAVTAFADPEVQFGLRIEPGAAAEEAQPTPDTADEAPAEDEPDPTPQVISLDAFRRRDP